METLRSQRISAASLVALQRAEPLEPSLVMDASPAVDPQALSSLLERRLLIVTGKGGTGKTAVAATLAWAAHRAGLRVLAAEMGGERDLLDRLSPGATAAPYPGQTVAPGLDWIAIDPFEALIEYLALQIRSDTVARRALGSGGLHQLLEGAPGWRELITLGKIWHVEQAREPDGRPLYDLIVVDAPATGHGLTFLDVPRTVVSAVRSGPLRRNAANVEALIRDPALTALLPVALAEELPANETAELVTRLQADVQVPVDRVIVNSMIARPLPEALSDLPRDLEAQGDAPLGEALPSPLSMARCLQHLNARHTLQCHYLEMIAERTGLPTLPLPFLPQGLRGPEELSVLADALLGPGAERSR